MRILVRGLELVQKRQALYFQEKGRDQARHHKRDRQFAAGIGKPLAQAQLRGTVLREKERGWRRNSAFGDFGKNKSQAWKKKGGSYGKLIFRTFVGEAFLESAKDSDEGTSAFYEDIAEHGLGIFSLTLGVRLLKARAHLSLS